MPNSLAEKLYYAFPVWAQNLAFTLKGYQFRWRRYNRYFYERLEELRRSEWWSAEQIAQYKTQKLGELLSHAAQSVPYYRDHWRHLGIDHQQVRSIGTLAKLPLLTKQEARQSQKQLVSERYQRQRLIRLLTSGTTGTPLCVRATRQSQGFQWAIWWRHRARFGLHFGDRHLMFGARVPIPASQSRPPFWRHDRALKRVYLSTYHLTPQNMPEIVQWLNTQDFDFYTGYPSAMYVLARFMQERSLRLLRRPKYIVTGSDALLPHFESAIRQVFGVPVTETWGMTEFAGNLSKCEHGRFHEDFESCHIEALPIEGADPALRKLVCTGWGNPAMPFIRYEVGDYARICDDPCPCGRESRCFLSVDGRTEDYIRTPDGRMAIGMNQVLEYAPGAREIQLYQERLDEVQVRVVPGPVYGASDESALTRELRRRLGDQITIRFVQMEQIPRTSSGKFRAVVSSLTGTSAGERELSEAVNR